MRAWRSQKTKYALGLYRVGVCEQIESGLTVNGNPASAKTAISKGISNFQGFCICHQRQPAGEVAKFIKIRAESCWTELVPRRKGSFRCQVAKEDIEEGKK